MLRLQIVNTVGALGYVEGFQILIEHLSFKNGYNFKIIEYQSNFFINQNNKIILMHNKII